MTFEDAVWIGLGLKVDEAGNVRKPKRHEVEGCAYCERYKGQMHPSHDASARCESGKHEHCTCDVCF